MMRLFKKSEACASTCCLLHWLFFIAAFLVAAFFFLQESVNPEVVSERKTTLHFTIHNETMVLADELQARLSIELRNAKKEDAEAELHAIMEKAMPVVSSTDIINHTERYYVRPQYAYNREAGVQSLNPKYWQAGETLVLKTLKSDAIISILQSLQSLGFQTESIDYTLSRKLLAETKEALRNEAISEVQSTAEKYQNLLNKKSYHLHSITIDPNQRAVSPLRYQSNYNRISTEAAKANPTIEAPEIPISIELDTVILLDDKEED